MYVRSKRLSAFHLVALFAITLGLALVVPWSGVTSPAARATLVASALGVAAGSPISDLNFNFQPSTVSIGGQVTASVTFSGGTPNFYLWFNNTPAGCTPGGPQMSPSDSFTINCRPTSGGTFTTHLDVLDSASPPSRASATATLTVTGNGNNNNGSGNNNSNNGGNGSFSLPGGLITIAMFGGAAFLAALVAIAAGTIATAVKVSRRLREVNETLQKLTPPPTPPSPPK